MERAQLQYYIKGDWSNCKSRKEKWKVPYFEVDSVVTASFSFSWRLKVPTDELNSMSSLPLCSAQYGLPFDVKFLHGRFFLVIAILLMNCTFSPSHLITFLYSTTECRVCVVLWCSRRWKKVFFLILSSWKDFPANTLQSQNVKDIIKQVKKQKLSNSYLW